MENTERLFVSLQMPAVCQGELADLQQELRGVVWGAPEQFHLTLRFLGDVESPLALRIEEELAKVRVEPFLLPLGGDGRFPPRGPVKVLWSGVGSGHTRLHQLRKKVDDAVLAAGWRGELRNFDPHVSLGRVNGEAELSIIDKWLQRHRDFEGPFFRVTGFSLMKSELRPGGALHSLRRRFELA